MVASCKYFGGHTAPLSLGQSVTGYSDLILHGTLKIRSQVLLKIGTLLTTCNNPETQVVTAQRFYNSHEVFCFFQTESSATQCLKVTLGDRVGSSSTLRTTAIGMEICAGDWAS